MMIPLTGAGAAVRRVREQIREAARSGASVWLAGEPGTGKEAAARQFHRDSDPEGRLNFIQLNCAPVPRDLFGAELFGFLKGAVEGAPAGKPGRIELAGRGTLFLNRIEAMPLDAQEALAAACAMGRFRRLGGDRDIPFEAKLVCASNRAPERLAEKGRLHPALALHATGRVIEMPPLRERVEDLEALTEAFLKKLETEYEKPLRTPGRELTDKMREYAWPGNAAELLEILRVYARHVDEAHALEELGRRIEKTPVPGEDAEAWDKNVIMYELYKNRWNEKTAAEILGINYREMQRFIQNRS